MRMRHLGYRFLFGMLWGIILLGLYCALQNRSVFDSSIGRLTLNYVKEDVGGDLRTVRRSAPFPKITDDDFAKWDAAIYRCIRLHHYSQEPGCYHNVRSAFFPLFPLAWQVFPLNNLGISILNFCLFVLSLSILSAQFGGASNPGRTSTFMLCIAMPSSVIFAIPYSESIALFCFVILVLGWQRSIYWLYFIGALGLSMSRAAMFFAFATMCFLYLLKIIEAKNKKAEIGMALWRCAPWCLGIMLVFGFQYYSSGEKFSFFEAQQFWDRQFRLPTKFVDWSQEGFGMSFFTLIVVCLPITVYFFRNLRSLISGKNFLFTWSLGYMTCMTFYCLFTTGGSLHSFYRHVLCSPFFFLLVFTLDLENEIFNINLFRKMIWLALVFCVFCVVPYGGVKLKFEYLGFYILAAYYIWFCFKYQMTDRQRRWSLAPVVIASLIWNAWLLNMYVTGAWVFT